MNRYLLLCLLVILACRERYLEELFGEIDASLQRLGSQEPELEAGSLTFDDWQRFCDQSFAEPYRPDSYPVLILSSAGWQVIETRPFIGKLEP